MFVSLIIVFRRKMNFMLKTLDVPTSNISELKKSPTKLFQKAANAKTGVYIFNRDTPSGVVMDVKNYEKMVHELRSLQEKLFDQEAAIRLKENDKVYSDEEVRGKLSKNKSIILDDDDGWE